ncbi:NAD(P)H-binding protein [Halobaculum sp. P14]|uniref:NAD(P)H-binding protein n=1 Tax=Halobaculum sp. P14 TaxID=3421638 RepID=UPI003EBD6094
MRVLVTDAAGPVGGRLVPALAAAGHEPVVLVRDADAVDVGDDVRVIEGDPAAPESFRLVTGASATAGQSLARLLTAVAVDAAYVLGDDPLLPTDESRAVATAAADAAAAAGVDRIVTLGALGDRDPGTSDSDADGDEAESDDTTADVAAGGGAPAAETAVTTLRTGVVVGAGVRSFEIARRLAARHAVAVTPRWVRTDCQPVAVDDLVASLVAAVDAAGGTFDVGGPDVVTFGSLLRRIRAALGGRLYALPVPVAARRLSARWVASAADVDAADAAAFVDAFRAPLVAADGAALHDHVGGDAPSTPVSDAVGRALGVDDADADPGSAGTAAEPPLQT